MKPLSHLLTIISAVLICFFVTLPAAPVCAQEAFRFQRMWPTLKQPWYFLHPYGIAADDDGYIFVADSENHRIRKFTANGQFITEWGTQGTGDGDFEIPSGIAVDFSGFVYVVDNGNNRIQKFTPDGRFVLQWGRTGDGDGEFDAPFAVCTDGLGYVYVTDVRNRRIQKFTGDGQFVLSWNAEIAGGVQPFSPFGIAADRGNFIYVTDNNNDRVLKFTTEGRYVFQWGAEGDGDGAFYDPDGITVDENGDVYVTDLFNHRVQKFTSQGQFLTKWGKPGTRGGEFNDPGGMAVDRRGYIYVTDKNNNRIQKFTTNGHLSAIWGTDNEAGTFNLPKGIALGPAGDFVYVADTENHRIQKFTRKGGFVDEWGTEGFGPGEFFGPEGIAAAPDGRIYVADTGNHRVQIFDANGQYQSEIGGLGTAAAKFLAPFGVALDKAGTLYVADTGNHRIQAFHSDGTILEWGTQGVGDGEFDNPQSVAADDNGFVYVADTRNHRVQKFKSDGEFVAAWGTKGGGEGNFDLPFGVSTGPEGHIYVADSGNHRVQKFSSDGQLVAAWGERGSAPGRFQYPADVAVDSDGEIFVADSDNHRIQAFRQFADEMVQKAVIVAGGGPYAGNFLWNATRLCTTFAYRGLTYQGFPVQNIRYLTADTGLDLDGNGEADDVFGPPSADNLQQSVTDWAQDADRLVVYLADHGGDGAFRLSDTEILSASVLDAWLDDGPSEIILIYDACNSGSFLPTLTAPEGQKRIIITSTGAGEDAYFITQGSVSFSMFFWSAVFNGHHLQTAFNQAGDALERISAFQHPEMTVQGDIIPDTVVIGAGTPLAGDAPVIEGVSPDQIITGSQTAVIFADVTDDKDVERVWAVIRPPYDPVRPPDEPVLELPSVELRPVGENRYEAECTGFNIPGTYDIVVYARDRDGNTGPPALIHVSVESPLRRRAVIVVGGGESSAHWPAVQHNAATAYRALKFQGYSDEDIYFLSPVTFSTGFDALSTPDNVRFALETWPAEQTADLVVYLVGEGQNGKFRLNDTAFLTGEEINQWLNSIQEIMPGTLSVICEFSYSGGFLPLLKPEGLERKRITISGTASDQPALFLSGGEVSFSAFLWNRIMNGRDLRTAFRTARDAVLVFTGGDQDQGPQLDDNGNGIGNERPDGQIAGRVLLGAGIRADENEPVVTSVEPDIVLSGETNAVLETGRISLTGEIASVWAVITPPDAEHGFSNEMPLPVVNLERTAEGYSKTYGGFDKFGLYRITYYASDTEGNISTSKTSLLYQSEGADMFENDSAAARAGSITVSGSIPQHHNFHAAGDEDWVRFLGIGGETYTFSAVEQGTRCSAVMEVYDSGNNLIDSRNTPLGERELSWDWRCPRSGIWYLKIRNMESNVFGPETSYRLSVYRPVGPFTGFLKGEITDAVTREKVQNVRVRTDANASALSRPDGRFFIVHEPGTFTVTLEADGYAPMVLSGVPVSQAGTTAQDFVLTPIAPADSDHDGVPDETDRCPNDPNKFAPGECGCGVSDRDSDGDGSPDCLDQCPENSEKTEPGSCGCEFSETDSDGDSAPDCLDQCPEDPEKTLPGICGCGVREEDADGNGIPDCRESNADSDGDGIADRLDGCPADPAKAEPGLCGCGIPDTDWDEDGTPDCMDDDHKPVAPVLKSPENGILTGNFTPRLQLGGFSDPDMEDFHDATRWQISDMPDFSAPLMDITTDAAGDAFELPPFLLTEGTVYYWRAKFYDNRDTGSDWSTAFSFITPEMPDLADAGGNGVPDQQEDGIPLDTDLDKNGLADLDMDPKMKVVRTVIGNAVAGVRNDRNILTIGSFRSLLPTQADIDTPAEFPFGAVRIQAEIENSDDPVRITVYFSRSFPESIAWYYFDALNGWQHDADTTLMNYGDQYFEIELWDGGPGDLDQTSNGRVTYVAGPGMSSAASKFSDFEDPSDDIDATGCFIGTAAGTEK